jgi:hypothetical protein
MRAFIKAGKERVRATLFNRRMHDGFFDKSPGPETSGQAKLTQLDRIRRFVEFGAQGENA